MKFSALLAHIIISTLSCTQRVKASFFVQGVVQCVVKFSASLSFMVTRFFLADHDLKPHCLCRAS